MADDRSKRVRSSNFTDTESEALLIAVESRIDVISNRSNTAGVCQKKRQAWIDIAKEVNAVGRCSRSWESVKKRWKDMKLDEGKVKSYASGIGGGPPLPEQKVGKEVLSLDERKKQNGLVGNNGQTFTLDDGESVTVLIKQEIIDEFGEISCPANSGCNAEQSGPKSLCPHSAAFLQRLDNTPNTKTKSDYNADQSEPNSSCPRSTPFSQQQGNPSSTKTNCDQAPASLHKQTSAKRQVKLSNDEDLNDDYLRSCISKNKADVEVQLLKKQKLLLEIELLKKQLGQ